MLDLLKYCSDGGWFEGKSILQDSPKTTIRFFLMHSKPQISLPCPQFADRDTLLGASTKNCEGECSFDQDPGLGEGEDRLEQSGREAIRKI